jgi:hypothetical protein
MVEAFKKILETTVTKICNMNKNDWDLRVPVVLWAYRTTCKKLTMQTPFKLVYGLEVVVLMEYLVPRLRIVAFTDPGGYRGPPTFSKWLKTIFWPFWQFTIFSRFSLPGPF